MMIGPDGVALGFRFHPSDEELVGNILYKIAVGRHPIHLTAPYDTVFHSEDLFGTKEPWEFWDEYGGDQLVLIPHLYFCCELKTVTKNGSRINRKVGSAGTWSEGPPPKTVFNSADKPMGRKRSLRYENSNAQHPHHGKWLLDEYSILVPAGDQAKPNPTRRQRNTNTNNNSQPTSSTSRLVICRLRKSDRPQNSTALNVGKESKDTKKNKNGSPAAGGIKKRKLSSIMDEEQPPVNTEEEIIETTTSKKMRSEDQMVLMESSQVDCGSTSSSEYLPADLGNFDVGCSAGSECLPDLRNFDVGCSTSECLPDLSNFDLETEIDWDFDPSMFEKFEFDKLLSCPAAAQEPTTAWW